MIHNLTGIRGFLALWVVLFHVQIPFAASSPFSHFADRGYLGVDAFFILSGYILTHVYGQILTRDTVPDYLVKRFSRIYPLHFVCLSVFLVLGVFKEKLNPGLEQPWNETAQNYLMIHAWGTTEMRAWNWPSWSISAEWFAYLFIFPALAIRKVKPAVKLLLSLATWAALIAYSELSNHAGMIGYTTLGILRIVPEFIFGSFLYDVFAGKELKRKAWMLLITAAAYTAAVIYLIPSRIDYFLLPVLGAIIVLAEKGGAISNTLFGNKISVYLGKISYAIYITQAIVLSLIGYIIESPMVQQKIGISQGLLEFLRHPVYKTVTIVTLCILLSMAAYHAIESPMRKMINRKVIKLRWIQRLKLMLASKTPNS
jgi:peptidoglycan/LPS O-acetylase OafA/YrhL